MAKKEGEINIESDTWNVAKGYTTLKVLKPLVDLDDLITLALYGTDRIAESLNTPPQIKVLNRIEAIKRIIDVLKLLFENTYFALDKTGKGNFDKLKEELEKVEKVIDGIYHGTTDQRTKQDQVKINEKHFMLCLNKLRDIKQKCNEPLNRANLIFPSSEEVDLEKLKDELVGGG